MTDPELDCCCCCCSNNEEHICTCSCASCVGQSIDIRNFGATLDSFYLNKAITPIQTRAVDQVQPTVKKVIEEFNVPTFVHGNVSVNLCGTPTKYSNEAINEAGYLESDFYNMSKLISDMHFSQQLGARGMVVHVGKPSKRFKPAVALERMEWSIKHLLKETDTMPLLLETPAGQGSELCNKIEELADFCINIDNPLLKVCIDTCHVFAAGYEPIEYLKLWTENYGAESVGLVHFNDSKCAKGGRLDRHAYWLNPEDGGHIGFKRMAEIRHYCHRLDIPMVTE